MTDDQYRKWSLGAEVLGFFAIVVSIGIVIYELNQTRTEMRAASSNARTEASLQIAKDFSNLITPSMTGKAEKGLELTPFEQAQSRLYFGSLLRFYENFHYQNELGVLDTEIWDSMSNAIYKLCSDENTLYSYLYPDGMTDDSFRSSFVELINDPCTK